MWSPTLYNKLPHNIPHKHSQHQLHSSWIVIKPNMCLYEKQISDSHCDSVMWDFQSNPNWQGFFLFKFKLSSGVLRHSSASHCQDPLTYFLIYPSTAHIFHQLFLRNWYEHATSFSFRVWSGKDKDTGMFGSNVSSKSSMWWRHIGEMHNYDI